MIIIAASIRSNLTDDDGRLDLVCLQIYFYQIVDCVRAVTIFMCKIGCFWNNGICFKNRSVNLNI
jgi:hypothetical protein